MPPPRKSKPKGKPPAKRKPPGSGLTIPKTRSKSPAKNAHKPKTFEIVKYGSSNEGDKICIYGKSGIGKSTLLAQRDNSVFIPVADGDKKIMNPFTGEDINAVPRIECFQDVRDCLHQKNLFPDESNIVIDTFTRLEPIIQEHVLATVPGAKGGMVQSFRQYGWDGDRHLLDHYRILLSDLDHHVRAGRSVTLLCQLGSIKVSNAAGDDYQEDGPKLPHRSDCSTRTDVCEWCDHVFRIGYEDFEVSKDHKDDKVGKVTSTDLTHAIFTGGAAHFFAKSRMVRVNRDEPYRIPTVISFESETDDSLWQYLYEGAVEGED